MSLSTFQRAVLQEMGIPVWVSQSSLQDENASREAADVSDVRPVNTSAAQTASAHSPVMPSNEEKQSKLAQLRAQVSSDSSKASSQSKASSEHKAAIQNSGASPSVQSMPTSTSIPESGHTTKTANEKDSDLRNHTPALASLTQVQQLQGKQWLQDLDIAIAHLNLALASSQVKIGQDLAVTNREIVLPTAPHLLTASMQKQLWKMLCASANNPSSL